MLHLFPGKHGGLIRGAISTSGWTATPAGGIGQAVANLRGDFCRGCTLNPLSVTLRVPAPPKGSLGTVYFWGLSKSEKTLSVTPES